MVEWAEMVVHAPQVAVVQMAVAVAAEAAEALTAYRAKTAEMAERALTAE